MKENIQTLCINFTNSFYSKQLRRFFCLLVIISEVSLQPLQKAKSEEIFLKCTGKYEINRGLLIEPDWEESYLKINLNGLMSTVVDKAGKNSGTTLIRRNSYKITQRDDRNNIKKIYKVNRQYGTYMYESPQTSRTLIGTCQKSRG